MHPFSGELEMLNEGQCASRLNFIGKRTVTAQCAQSTVRSATRGDGGHAVDQPRDAADLSAPDRDRCRTAAVITTDERTRRKELEKENAELGLDHVEFSALGYIDWFNHRRLHGQITEDNSYVTPAEFEAIYYRQTQAAFEAVTQ